LGNENSNRRGFIRRLGKLVAAGGVATLLLGQLQEKKGLLPEVQAQPYPIYIDQSNTGTGSTLLTSSISSQPAFEVRNTATSVPADGIWGRSDSTDGLGVYGLASAASGWTIGVYGRSNSTSGRGVEGYAGATSGTTYGVRAISDSTSGTGVYGLATAAAGSTKGVYGQSNSMSGVGVEGVAGYASAKPIVARGAYGQTANLQEWQNSAGTALSVVDRYGKLGVGTTTPIASVQGVSSSGTGVYGYSNTGYGVRARSVSGNALYVDGKNYFKSAQRGVIPSGVSSYVVTVPAGITIRSAAMIFATLMSNPGGVSVKWVQRLSDTQFKIYLTGTTTSTVAFGYFIVN